MSVVLKQMTCPNCGSNVEQLNATSQTLVCKTCNTHIDAGDGNAIGSGQKLSPPPKPIQIGQTGTFMGVECIVLGRVFHEGWATSDSSDRWVWNEWLLGAADGRIFWLSYDNEDGFVLSHKKRIKAPFSPLMSSSIPIEKDGRTVRVKERYPSRILGAEGELLSRVERGQMLTMIEANGFGREYSIQYTTGELEMYEGIPLEEKAVARAFGDATWTKRSERQANNQQLLSFAGIASLVFGCVALFLAAIGTTSGSLMTTQTLTVNRESPIAQMAFEVDSTNRPMLIRMNTSALPVNSWAELEVSVTDPVENETFIGGSEFWHETGFDDGGAWQESDYTGTARFIPVETGTHLLKVEFEDGATNVSGTAVTVEIYENHFVETWLIVYGAMILILGIILIVSSRPQQVANLMSS